MNIERPLLFRVEAAALLGVTLDELARMEAADPDLIRSAGVRTTYHGEPTIRYRRAALVAWLEGRAA